MKRSPCEECCGHLRDEVHEASQRLVRLVPHVAELHHHLLLQLVVDDRHGERRRLVGQEAAIVGALQVELQIWRRGMDNLVRHLCCHLGLFIQHG